MGVVGKWRWGGQGEKVGLGVDPGMYTYCCSGILYDI